MIRFLLSLIVLLAIGATAQAGNCHGSKAAQARPATTVPGVTGYVMQQKTTYVARTVLDPVTTLEAVPVALQPVAAVPVCAALPCKKGLLGRMKDNAQHRQDNRQADRNAAKAQRNAACAPAMQLVAFTPGVAPLAPLPAALAPQCQDDCAPTPGLPAID